MKELSPAAFAVVDAFVCANARKSDPSSNADIAAALRAAADQVVPEVVHPDAEKWMEYPTWTQVESRVRLRLLAIADELESI